MKTSAFAFIAVAVLSMGTPAEAQRARFEGASGLMPAQPGGSASLDFDRIIRTTAVETKLAVPAPSLTAQASPAGSAHTSTARGEGASPARSAQAGTASRSERGVGKRILGGIVGGAAGFFAGGYAGAAIEGDRCHCDDPGLKGALIGMPIGAAIGAWAGQRWLF